MAEEDSEKRQVDEIPISPDLLRLSPREVATMMEILATPPEPSPRLICAAKLYNERIRKDSLRS